MVPSALQPPPPKFAFALELVPILLSVCTALKWKKCLPRGKYKKQKGLNGGDKGHEISLATVVFQNDPPSPPAPKKVMRDRVYNKRARTRKRSWVEYTPS